MAGQISVEIPGQFSVEINTPAPYRLWVSDFTYVSTWAGFVYVAFVVDIFARYIRGLACEPDSTCWLRAGCPWLAIHDRRPVNNLIHHSDRGKPIPFDQMH